MTREGAPPIQLRPLLLCAALAAALSGCQCVRADEVVLVGCGPAGECSGATRCCADLLCHDRCEDTGADAGQADAGPVDAGLVDAGSTLDAGSPVDAGLVDAGAPPDAGSPVDAGAEPTTLTVVTAPISVEAGRCSPSPIRFELRDDLGARASVRGSPLAVVISSAPAGLAFFDDAACANAIPGSTLSLAPGRTGGEIYFQSTTLFPAPQGVRVTLVAPALPAPGNTVGQVQFVELGPPARLAWRSGATPPSSAARFRCLANLAVDVTDAYGNPTVSPGAPASRTLSPSASSAAAGASFFASPDCSGAPVSALSLSASASGTSLFSLVFTGTGPTTVAVADLTSGALQATPNAMVTVTGTGTLLVNAPTSDIEAFDCEPIAVSRAGPDGAWRLGATSVTVSLPNGTTELSLHSTSSCTDPGALSQTATIPDGSASTQVYVRGLSGGPTTVSVTATDAAAAFASGAVSVTAIPLVRRGTCVLPANTTSVTCAISPALAATDLDHTFMVYQATGNQVGAGAAGVVCAMQSTSAIACSRWVAGTSPMDITWQTASWGRHSPGVGGVRVQHLTGVTAAVLGPVDVPFKPVTSLSNTFVLFGHTVEGVTLNSNDWATAVPIDAQTLRLTTTSFGLRYSYEAQIVEFEGAVVDRASYTGVATGAGFTLTGLTSMPVDRTAMLFTSRQDTLNDDIAICKRTWRGQVTATDGLAFTRSAATGALACTNNNAAETAWQRLQFPSGTTVQGCDATIGGAGTAAASTTCALATAVTAHRTLVWLAGQGPGGQAMGESAHATTDDIGHVNAGVSLTSPTEVTVTRGSSSATPSVFTPTVIEFSVL